MPSLIHLNGPPGIGKSTLSALYADRHPGTLNLDIDRLHHFVGGWQLAPYHAHDILRPIALAMASTHLSGGRDVVLPQYLAKTSEIERFEHAADEQRAHFREIVLLDDRAAAIAHFATLDDESAWGRYNRRTVAEQGGSTFLAAMYDRLVETVRLRPSAITVPIEPGSVEATYARLVDALTLLEDGEPDRGHNESARS